MFSLPVKPSFLISFALASTASFAKSEDLRVELLNEITTINESVSRNIKSAESSPTKFPKGTDCNEILQLASQLVSPYSGREVTFEFQCVTDSETQENLLTIVATPQLDERKKPDFATATPSDLAAYKLYLSDFNQRLIQEGSFEARPLEIEDQNGVVIDAWGSHANKTAEGTAKQALQLLQKFLTGDVSIVGSKISKSVKRIPVANGELLRDVATLSFKVRLKLSETN